MKKQLLYMLTLCAALLMAGCQKDEVSEYGHNEGGIVMSLAGTTTRVAAKVKSLDECTVYIYEKKAKSDELTLIRKYLPGNLPSKIKLLAGSYSVRVAWGEEPDIASLTSCYYEGSADFTITAGQTSTVEVTCYPKSTTLQVTFDLVKEVSDPQVTFTMLDAPKGIATDNIVFTKNDEGYFTVPEGETANLGWIFEAQHAMKGKLKKSQSIQVESGKLYKLTYKYSPDAPGYIEIFTLEVDPKTEEHNDTFVFTSNPEIKGDIINSGSAMEYTGEGVTLTMETSGGATVKEAYIYQIGATVSRAVDERLLWSWTDDKENTTAVKSELSEDKTALSLTLNPAFFAFPIGDTELRFEVIDTNDAKNEKAVATIRMNEGLRVVTAEDYDLWSNTLTLHAVSTSGNPTFKMRRAGTDEWRTLPGVAGSNGEFSATFAPGESDWETSYNDMAGVNVYRPKTDHCVYANNTYEAAVEIAGHEYRTTFYTATGQTIDLPAASSSCYTTNNRYATFWGSGNNDYATALCSYAPKNGVPCAHLQSTMAGAFGITMLASGNLFTGTFYRPSTTGTVSFGQDYAWEARPTAFHVKYHATIGNVTAQKHKLNGNHPLNIGDPDKSVIYVAIVDWEAPHDVKSGTSSPEGMWSPDEANAQSGSGNIIGYGIKILDKSVEGDELIDLEVPIFYYDKVTKPSNAYKLVISAATNYYGDFMCGCENNEMWLTDFRWVY